MFFFLKKTIPPKLLSASDAHAACSRISKKTEKAKSSFDTVFGGDVNFDSRLHLDCVDVCDILILCGLRAVVIEKLARALSVRGHSRAQEQFAAFVHTLPLAQREKFPMIIVAIVD